VPCEQSTGRFGSLDPASDQRRLFRAGTRPGPRTRLSPPCGYRFASRRWNHLDRPSPPHSRRFCRGQRFRYDLSRPGLPIGHRPTTAPKRSNGSRAHTPKSSDPTFTIVIRRPRPKAPKPAAAPAAAPTKCFGKTRATSKPACAVLARADDLVQNDALLHVPDAEKCKKSRPPPIRNRDFGRARVFQKSTRRARKRRSSDRLPSGSPRFSTARH